MLTIKMIVGAAGNVDAAQAVSTIQLPRKRAATKLNCNFFSVCSRVAAPDQVFVNRASMNCSFTRIFCRFKRNAFRKTVDFACSSVFFVAGTTDED